jgi:GNAT superfamily N-acetyltransferase
MMAFALESLAHCEAEMRGMIGMYLEEVTTPFEKQINWAYYRELERSGTLSIITVREEGGLVGFLAFNVFPHPHTKDTMVAQEAAMFLRPECRKGLTGARLIREAEVQAKQRGAQYQLLTTRPGKDLSQLLLLRGYKPFETAYFKEL